MAAPEFIEVSLLADPVTIDGVTRQAERWVARGVLRIAKVSGAPRYWLVRVSPESPVE